MKQDSKALSELRKKIKQANTAYRTGEAVMSDAEYDALLDSLSELTDGKDPLLEKVGFDPDDDRKEELPVSMYSMNKVKSAAEIAKWAELKNIPLDKLCVLTPKYDGLSLLVEEPSGRAWTRGNGIIGQRSDSWYKKIVDGKFARLPGSGYTTGEMIMPRSVFSSRHASSFRNSRNMGAGMINAKEIRPELSDFDYLRFAIVPGEGEQELSKVEQVKLLNKHCNRIPVPWKEVTIGELDDELLEKVYDEFRTVCDYEMDGLILELNDPDLRKNLGREKNGNPVYARAWKGFQEEARTTTVEKIDWQISKHGLLKPVGRISPVELDGVTVSNVTLINARFVADNKLGKGSEVKVIRSGQVIPKVIAVLKGSRSRLPSKCPACKTSLEWNQNDIELLCPNIECPERQVQQLVAFFTILEVENLAEGVVRQLYEAGYKTVASILELSVEELASLDGFQERKAGNIHSAIRDKLTDIPLEQLMHATSIFPGLGRKKLALLRQFDAPEKCPNVETVREIDGFQEKTANVFVANFPRFWEFIRDLPVTIAGSKQTSSSLDGWNVVFSGVRRADLESLLEEHGGRSSGSVSKKTSHLVMKSKGSGSSKEKKAESLDIPILTEQEFESLLSEKGLL
jgi:DNA ligase (NAD+)